MISESYRLIDGFFSHFFQWNTSKLHKFNAFLSKHFLFRYYNKKHIFLVITFELHYYRRNTHH